MPNITVSVPVDTFLKSADAAAMRTNLGVFTPRVVSVAYAATITPNADTTDILIVGPLTAGVSLANPSGTPYDGQKIEIRWKQDGTGGRSLTLSGGQLRLPSSSSLSSPISEANFIVASKKTAMLLEYDAADTTWDVRSFVSGY